MARIHEAPSSAVLTMSKPSTDSEDEPCLVLHARMTNMYFVMIFFCVSALVTIARAFCAMWQAGIADESAGFLGGISILLLIAVVHFQKKARWLSARPSGLTITERKGSRVVPWRDVRVVDDLGWLGGGPGAKRYYLELNDGTYFTFLGDPLEMTRLKHLREDWTRRSRDEKR